jgi:urea transport system permease protein
MGSLPCRHDQVRNGLFHMLLITAVVALLFKSRWPGARRGVEPHHERGGGIDTRRVDRLTFGLGCGSRIAGSASP